MTQKLTQLQQAIREVCTELRQGSEVVLTTEDHKTLTIDIPEGYLMPIELQHILRAMNMPIKYFTRNPTTDIRLIKLLFLYNLTLPLDRQSPEVIDFLHSIICKG